MLDILFNCSAGFHHKYAEFVKSLVLKI